MKSILNKIIKVTIFLVVIVLFVQLVKKRICLFWNLFNIPCVGCGLTRGMISILHLDFASAIKYNFLSVIFFIVYIVSVIWTLIDYILKKETFSCFIKNNKKIIIVVFAVLTIVGWCRNISNPLLY